MKCNSVAFGVHEHGDEAVLADIGFGHNDLTSSFFHSGEGRCYVIVTKANQYEWKERFRELKGQLYPENNIPANSSKERVFINYRQWIDSNC